jgi:hypothetical protein
MFAIVFDEAIIFASEESRFDSSTYLLSFSSGSSGRLSLISLSSLSEIHNRKKVRAWKVPIIIGFFFRSH